MMNYFELCFQNLVPQQILILLWNFYLCLFIFNRSNLAFSRSIRELLHSSQSLKYKDCLCLRHLWVWEESGCSCPFILSLLFLSHLLSAISGDGILGQLDFRLDTIWPFLHCCILSVEHIYFCKIAYSMGSNSM